MEVSCLVGKTIHQILDAWTGALASYYDDDDDDDHDDDDDDDDHDDDEDDNDDDDDISLFPSGINLPTNVNQSHAYEFSFPFLYRGRPVGILGHLGQMQQNVRPGKQDQTQVVHKSTSTGWGKGLHRRFSPKQFVQLPSVSSR